MAPTISSLCFSQLLAFLYTSCLKADQLHSRRCQFSNTRKSKPVPGLWQWQKGKITGSNFLLIPRKKFNAIAQHLTINSLRSWQDFWHWRAAFLAPKPWLNSQRSNCILISCLEIWHRSAGHSAGIAVPPQRQLHCCEGKMNPAHRLLPPYFCCVIGAGHCGSLCSALRNAGRDTACCYLCVFQEKHLGLGKLLCVCILHNCSTCQLPLDFETSRPAFFFFLWKWLQLS